MKHIYSILNLPMLMLLTSFVSLPAMAQDNKNSYDKQIHDKAKVLVDQFNRRFDKLENRWVRQFEDKVYSVGQKKTRKEIADNARGKANNFASYQDVFEKYRTWQTTGSTTARDSFRRRVPYLIANVIETSWRTQQSEAWYRMRVMEYEFFEVKELKTYQQQRELVRKSYGYDGDEHDAALLAFNKKIAVIENKQRQKVLTEYKNLTQEMLDRRQELAGIGWAWVTLYEQLGDSEAAKYIKKELYKTLAYNVDKRHQSIYKEIGINPTFDDSPVDYWVHEHTDKLRLNVFALPQDTPYRFSMHDALLKQRIDTIKPVTLEDKPRFYNIDKIKLDDLAWFTSFTKLKQSITDIGEELEYAKTAIKRSNGRVSQAQEIIEQIKREQTSFKKDIQQAERFIKSQKTDFPKSLQLDLKHSQTLQQSINGINLLISQLDPYKDDKELLKLAEDEKQLIEQKRISDNKLSEYKQRNTDQEKLLQAQQLITTQYSRRISLTHRLRQANIEQDYAKKSQTENKNEVQRLEASLKPLLDAKKQFDKIGKRLSEKQTLVNYVTVFADNKIKFSAHRYAPGTVLPELDQMIDATRRKLTQAKSGYDNTNAQFTEALELTQSELAQLAKVIEASAYAQTAIEGADFIYDILEANANGGPPAALVEALYKLAEQKVTGSTTIETLSEAEINAVEKEAIMQLNGSLKRSIGERKEGGLPSYLQTRSFEETIGNRIKTELYNSRLSVWAQTMIRDNRAMSLQQLFKQTPDLNQYLNIRAAKLNALTKAQERLDFLQEPFSINFKSAGQNLTKDIAKNWAKSIAKKAEHAAWYRYYLADVQARSLHPIKQEWLQYYYDTQDELKALMDARQAIIKGYDAKSGFRSNIDDSFEKGQVLRVILETDGGWTEHDVLLDNEKATGDGYRRFRIETTYIQSKAETLDLTIKEKASNIND